MVHYFDRHGLKQHIHGKPIHFGYKVWCMCTPECYLIQAEPYQGANTGDNIKGLGMGGSVVADLISELPHSNFSLFFENLFTSLPLMDYLSEAAFGGTGTIRLNRTEKAPLQEPASMKKKSRGSFEQKTNQRCWNYISKVERQQHRDHGIQLSWSYSSKNRASMVSSRKENNWSTATPLDSSI